MKNSNRLNDATRKMWVNTPILRAAMEMYAAHRRNDGTGDDVAVQVIAELDEFEKAWDEANLPQQDGPCCPGCGNSEDAPNSYDLCENCVDAMEDRDDEPMSAPAQQDEVPVWMAGQPIEMD
jgi:hypothetical protein